MQLPLLLTLLPITNDSFIIFPKAFHEHFELPGHTDLSKKFYTNEIVRFPFH